MPTKPNKKKNAWQKYIGFVFFLIAGAICGILMVNYSTSLLTEDGTLGSYLFSFAVLFVGLMVAIYIQVVIHEAGHLIFGLLTGYRFSSFRIGGFIWVKESGRIKAKKLSIAGTGGQCLLIPPDIVNKKIPFVLYNLGGAVLNAISGLIFGGLYIACRNVPFLSIFMLFMSIIGFAYSLMNGIPMRLGIVDNDGYNALSLGKNYEALYSFWVQLKVNGQISQGLRLKDMPEEWFSVPSDEGMKNSMTAVRGVLACNQLMDAHKLEEANSLMKRLLEMDSAMVGLHRSLMICDRIYCELIGESNTEPLDVMLDKQQKKFMKSMKKFPAVLRTEYAYALLDRRDRQKAKEIKNMFEKCACAYPYPSDIESERELMDMAERAV